MEFIEAKILLKNLLNRVEIQEDGSKQLTGVLTDDELEALKLALWLSGMYPTLLLVLRFRQSRRLFPRVSLSLQYRFLFRRTQ